MENRRKGTANTRGTTSTNRKSRRSCETFNSNTRKLTSHFKRVVAECSLKLRRDQRPESQQRPAWIVRWQLLLSSGPGLVLNSLQSLSRPNALSLHNLVLPRPVGSHPAFATPLTSTPSPCYFQYSSPGVAELADAADSKSAALRGRVGSTPSSGTNCSSLETLVLSSP